MRIEDRKQLKRLGQHFLKNPKILEMEADLAKIEGKEVLEIGAGNGSLTRQLLEKRPKKLIAVEIDRGLCFELKKKFQKQISQGILEIVNEDFLKLEIEKIDIIVGNVPYYISSQIILKLTKINFKQAILMMQKEFCQRLLAKPGTSFYGRLSAIANAYFQIEPLAIITKDNFYPQPKVDSQLIRIKKRPDPNLEKNFEQISAALFAHRLADVKNALKKSRKFFGFNKEQAKIYFEKFKKYDKKVFMLSWKEINQIAKDINKIVVR
ncbi:MAG: 16S rRNA (adenine(1518)-N(6)/adenine(1519)-N(6))-dimethyltransferase RsmA [Candidatus Anstonellaceae archaeon]